MNNVIKGPQLPVVGDSVINSRSEPKEPRNISELPLCFVFHPLDRIEADAIYYARHCIDSAQ